MAEILSTPLTVVHVIACLFLMLVVLVQPGKSGGLGAFTGVAAQQVFGGRGAGNILTKTTWVTATVFFFTSITLAYLSSSSDASLAKRMKMAAQHVSKPITKPLAPAPRPTPAPIAPPLPAPPIDVEEETPATPSASAPALTAPVKASQPAAAKPRAPGAPRPAAAPTSAPASKATSAPAPAPAPASPTPEPKPE